MRLNLLLLLAAIGCGGASTQDIEHWKTRDPDKVLSALKDARASVAVRGAAVAALSDIGWSDRVASAFAGIPLEDRSAVIAAAAPVVAQQLDGADAAKAWEARESLFALRQQATTDGGRAAVDGPLLAALERDLRAGRAGRGRHTLAEMLIALGPVTVPRMLAVIEDEKAPFAPAWAVLDKVGDKGAKEKGGTALARRAKAENPPKELWTALGHLGGADAVAALQDRIEHGSPEQAIAAAEGLAGMRGDPALLPFAVKAAGDARAPRPVRDHMVELMKKVGGHAARDGLVKLIAGETDPGFRYALFKAAIKASGGDALAPALEALPMSAAYTVEEIQKNLVPAIYEMGFENREGLYKALESKSALARMTAVLALEKSGFDSDVEKLSKLIKDRGAVKGFPPARTVGAETARVIALLKAQG